ncbi:uncharacterized protein [Anabrus simplex]|uniref:uncharacterized protein isoform X3 n=1 Tax=Anabrus simplex TaxID=316456 RepID=UPI0035A2E99B
MVHRIKHFSTGISAALLEVIYKLSTFELLHLQCEMDLKVQIKEEPVWVEVTADTSLENYELISEMIPLKQEIKSELTEPGRTQENTFEPSADIKEEILIEEHQVDPNIKENNEGLHHHPLHHLATLLEAFDIMERIWMGRLERLLPVGRMLQYWQRTLEKRCFDVMNAIKHLH